jgi:hypothetical protein
MKLPATLHALALGAVALIGLTSEARATHGAILSTDQCVCDKPTNDPFQPYRTIQFNDGPGCARARAGNVYWSCDDAQALLREQCVCIEPPQGNDEFGEIRVLAVSACKSVGATAGKARSCADLAAISRLPRDRCFCTRRIAKGQEEIVRFNWSPVCRAMRFEAGRVADLPSCEDAEHVLSKCFCQGREGARRLSSGPECQELEYRPLALKADDTRAQLNVAQCDAEEWEAPRRGRDGRRR